MNIQINDRPELITYYIETRRVVSQNSADSVTFLNPNDHIIRYINIIIIYYIFLIIHMTYHIFTICERWKN